MDSGQRLDAAFLLDELRYQQLHAALPEGWREEAEEPDSLWLPALRYCYDQITWYCLSEAFYSPEVNLKRLDPQYNVYGYLFPLDAKGHIHENKGLWIHSGKDLVLEQRPPGWEEESGFCAERKVLEKLEGRKVGLARQAHGQWGPDRNASVLQEFRQEMIADAEGIAAWLLYTTMSPCKYCGAAIAGQLAAGLYQHIVVVFENCYARNTVPELPPGEFFARVVHHPAQTGIEVFKVYRRSEDVPKLGAGMKTMMDDILRTLRNPHADQDPTLRVMRVTKV